jgi:uncharacterized protein (TIGR02271 family)
MQEDNIAHTVDLYRLVDYDVEDRNGNKIGKIEAVWEDESRQPVFLSVRTGWLGLGKRHFVPAHSAEASERSRTVRLPYDEDTVKNAPEFESEAHIDDAAERRIYEYYSAHGIAFPEYGRSDWTPSGRETEISAEKTIPLKEEELRVGKRSEEAGGVRIRKVVRTETVEQPVELKREDVVVERVQGTDRQPTDATFSEDEVYIPLRRERAEVSKEARSAGEIRAGKQTRSEQETVSGTVRKEDVEVEEDRSGRSG